MHPDYDAIERIQGAPRASGRDFAVDTEAKRAVRSRAFRGVAVQRREVEEGALAREIAGGAPAGTRLHARAWGGSAERPCARRVRPAPRQRLSACPCGTRFALFCESGESAGVYLI